MGVYDSQVALAERLIREKGKPVNIVRQGVVIPNPDKPWEPGDSTETLDDAYAVFLNFTSDDLATLTKMQGASEVQASDRKVLLAASALTAAPTKNDKLRDEDGDWSIEWINELSPNGQNIMYTLRARR